MQAGAIMSSTHGATDNFRRQHEELATLGTELLQQLALGTEDIVARAGDLRRLMARFAGKLKMHASMENEALYPRLFDHSDPSVREKAEQLFEEVKGIYAAFAIFGERWPTTAAIEANPTEFVRETRRIMKALWLRMARENAELYPLVDAGG
jgi:hypothetical protein